MIDWNKPIETMAGDPARVISIDFKRRDEVPVVLQIECANHSVIGHYKQNGEAKYGSPEIRNRKTKREGWINVYSFLNKVGCIYNTEQEAKESASLAVAATIKIEWEE